MAPSRSGSCRVRPDALAGQKDADLGAIRDSDAAAKLPAVEQGVCKKLWADVAALLKKAQEKPK